METVKTEITEYNATRAGLADITKRMKDVVYDLTTTSGMEAAKLDRRELISLRTNLESMRVVEKAPVLKRGKAIDAEAKLIEVEIRALEEPIDKQIKAVEKIAKDEKEKKLNATREKTRLTMERIEKLKALPERYALQTAEKVKEVIEQVKASPPDSDGFGDYLVLATEAYNETMVALIRLHEVKVETEAVAAKAEEDRLAEVEAERVRQADAQLILDKEKEELRIEREKFEDTQKEAGRIQVCKDRIEDCFGPGALASATIMNSIQLLDQITLFEEEDCTDDIFNEFTDTANDRRYAHIESLKLLFNQAKDKEAEAAKAETERLAKVEEGRVAAEAETKRLADLVAENEKKRKDAEKAKKISDRAARVAQAKCVSAGDAFQKILDIVNHEEMGNETKLDDIQVIAEANSH